MIDRWIELTHLLEREGIEVEMEGTPSVPVLYHRTDKGTVIGVDLETVCLYLDRGTEEAPLDLAYVQHGGDGTAIVNLIRSLTVLTPSPDLRHIVSEHDVLGALARNAAR